MFSKDTVGPCYFICGLGREVSPVKSWLSLRNTVRFSDHGAGGTRNRSSHSVPRWVRATSETRMFSGILTTKTKIDPCVAQTPSEKCLKLPPAYCCHRRLEGHQLRAKCHDHVRFHGHHFSRSRRMRHSRQDVGQGPMSIITGTSVCSSIVKTPSQYCTAQRRPSLTSPHLGS